jgi:hypothetical protein
MTEEFLYYLWKYRLFNFKCKTTEGQIVEVIKTGESNRDSGPDFINAKIKIGNTVWAGNVEIHLKSSDWYKHNHDKDKAYSNVILHVVYEHDKDVYRRPQSTDHSQRSNKKIDEVIPALVLKGKFNINLYENYKLMVESKNKIPCQKLLDKVDRIVMTGWKEALLVERLERKVKVIEEILTRNGNNWEQTFYQHLAGNFGFKINADAFEMLAKSIPYEYLAKHKDNLFQIEAILFGQAGLLEKEYKDDYTNELKNEYKYLKRKLSLKPIEGHLWKFLRLRPANFPTVRIAQFAFLLSHKDNLFSLITEAKRISDIEKIFKVKTSEYWERHYVFDKETKTRTKTKTIGKSSVNNIIINTVVPFVFLYGIKKDNFAFRERAIKFLELIPSENNSIINMWAGCGVKANNAFDSQALIELKNEYCSKKRCLECRIGHYAMSNEQ